MNAHDITNSLMIGRYRRNFCLPRYTPARWFECDVFELTPAGLWREYEVKLTRADFRADARKCGFQLNFDPAWIEKHKTFRQDGPTKHQRLVDRDPDGPSRFWFVTPEGLLKPEEVPPWAGLIEFFESSHHNALQERERIKAPTLHRQPLSERVVTHARTIPYYRMHDLLGRRPVAADPVNTNGGEALTV